MFNPKHDKAIVRSNTLSKHVLNLCRGIDVDADMMMCMCEQIKLDGCVGLGSTATVPPPPPPGCQIHRRIYLVLFCQPDKI